MREQCCRRHDFSHGLFCESRTRPRSDISVLVRGQPDRNPYTTDRRRVEAFLLVLNWFCSRFSNACAQLLPSVPSPDLQNSGTSHFASEHTPAPGWQLVIQRKIRTMDYQQFDNSQQASSTTGYHPARRSTTTTTTTGLRRHSTSQLAASDVLLHHQQHHHHDHNNNSSNNDVAAMRQQWASRRSMFRKSVLERVFDLDRNGDAPDSSTKHSWLYMTLHPRSRRPQAQTYRRVSTSVILVDLLAFILSTDASLFVPHKIVFRCFDGVTSTFFLIEYVARLVIVTESERYGSLGPVLGRIKWMCSFSAMVDLLATLPFFINLVTGWRFASLMYLRAFRVLRILKMDGYIRAFGACYRVLYYNREILYVAILVCVFLVVVSAVMMYYLRPRNVDSEIFASIPATLFTSLLMLTGQDSLIRSSQGMPWYTKVVVGLTGSLSVVMVALPVSLLTWGFEAEALRCARKTRRHMKRAQTFDSSEHTELDDFVDTEKVISIDSDEEYLQIIAKKTSNDKNPVDNVERRLSPEMKTKTATAMIEQFLKEATDGRRYEALLDFVRSSSRKNNPPSPPPQHRHHVDEDDSSYTIFGAVDTSDDSDTRRRIMNLESSVLSVHAKLESITSLLQQRSPSRVLKQETDDETSSNTLGIV